MRPCLIEDLSAGASAAPRTCTRAAVAGALTDDNQLYGRRCNCFTATHVLNDRRLRVR
jgi:hypothetical protein